MEKETIKAIKCTQNDRTFYLASLKSSILEKICFISRREESPKDGFQRALSEPRAKSIAKYMDEFKGCLPATLILSAQAKSNITFDEESNNLSFDIKDNSFMVLDGQHRLYGLLFAEKDYEIPVAIFDKLTIKDEVNLFIDINTNQKGVPTALLLDIKELTGKETSFEEKQRKLFDLINSDSPLAGLLSPNKSRTGFIARNVFYEATKDFLENGYFADKDVDFIHKGMKNYLEALELVFATTKSKKAKLTTANIFKASFSIFNDIIDKTFEKYGDLKVEHLQDILLPVANINYDDIGTNKDALKKLIAKMKAQLLGYSTKYRNYEQDSIF